MLERTRRSAAEEKIENLDFAVADAHALPFSDGVLDIAVTSFSLHHMPDPARVIGEMSRIVKRGGRVGVIDIRAPEDSKIAECANRIERIRDSSHTRSVPQSEFEKMFAASGLRIHTIEQSEDFRDFDSWMHVAGWKPGDETYAETRRLVEASLQSDSAGFHPQLVGENATATPILHIVHSGILIAAEKI